MDSNYLNFFNGAPFGLTVLALGMIVAHLIPWYRFFGRKLPRLWAYSIGSGIILAGFSTWRITGHSDLITPLALAVCYVIGGGVVITMYKIDNLGVTVEASRRLNRGEDVIHPKR